MYDDDIVRWTRKRDELKPIIEELQATGGSAQEVALLEGQLAAIEEHLGGLQRRRT